MADNDVEAFSKNIVASEMALRYQKLLRPDWHELIQSDASMLESRFSDDVVTEEDIAVDAFADKMKAKLRACKNRGREGWNSTSITDEELSVSLRVCVEDGDPVDVANYAMFLSIRKARIT